MVQTEPHREKIPFRRSFYPAYRVQKPSERCMALLFKSRTQTKIETNLRLVSDAFHFYYAVFDQNTTKSLLNLINIPYILKHTLFIQSIFKKKSILFLLEGGLILYLKQKRVV